MKLCTFQTLCLVGFVILLTIVGKSVEAICCYTTSAAEKNNFNLPANTKEYCSDNIVCGVCHLNHHGFFSFFFNLSENIQKNCYNGTSEVTCQWMYQAKPPIPGLKAKSGCYHPENYIMFLCQTDRCNGKKMDNSPNFNVEHRKARFLTTWFYTYLHFFLSSF